MSKNYKNIHAKLQGLKPLKISSDLNSIVNCYYIMAETLDMMLRQMELEFDLLGKDVIHSVKSRHTEMMRLMRMLRVNQEKFLKDYETFKGDWMKYDELRKSSAYISRIMLLVADRTLDDGEVEKHIEDYIKSLPSTGVVSENLLQKFKIL